jgi:pyrroline-5-carboxylate reductase
LTQEWRRNGAPEHFREQTGQRHHGAVCSNRQYRRQSGPNLPDLLSLAILNWYKQAMASDLRIGFLGAGKMASALAQGFIKARLLSAEQVLASDPSEQARSQFGSLVQSKTTARNGDIPRFAPVIFLAVKPDQVEGVLGELRDHLTHAHLLISIAAGVTLTRLENALNPGMRVVRVMPNTPALVGASATGFALGKAASSADGEMARTLFSAVGVAYQVKESLLDAVTGLSGSGPAYVYLVIEAMSDGGVAAGLPREIATALAAQTVLGAAKMVLETHSHPGVLKDMVTSPGGTTIEGLHELERGAVRAALIQAVRAAAEKSRKLGQQ